MRVIVLLLVSLQAVIVVLFWVLAARARGILQQNAELLIEIRALRLGSRARVKRLNFDANSEEAVLKRLGRESATRRIVVGGEDESEQKQGLVARWGGHT